MNAHDSDRMEEVLVANGWSLADGLDEADLVVLNTCSVREKAEQKLRSEVGKLAPFKAKNPGLVLAVAGCVAQQEGEKLLQRVPHLDLVIGPDNLAELPALALEQMSGAPPRARTVFDLDAPRFLAAQPRAEEGPVTAWVTTMKGCDERCSFCIVPYTRGPERYRPAAEIIAEIERWVAAGAREVTLLGQTVDSFRDPALPPPASSDPDESQFPALLAAIARQVPALARLRYTSPHPRHLTPSLVRAHAELDVLAQHVHMPVQSGSDRMLKRMIRRYTSAEYRARVAALKGARAGLTVSTDVIVGFPGETDDDFRATLDLVRDVGVTGVFGFKYSPRPFTPALKLADDVPEAVKSERLARLFELSESLVRAHLETLVGSTQEVLVEGPSKASVPDRPRVEGRTARNEIVHLDEPDGLSLTGALVAVASDRANKHSLVGTPTPDALARIRAAAPRPAAVKKKRRNLPVVAP